MNSIWLNAVRASGGAVPWWLAGGSPTPVAAYQPLWAASLAASYLRVAGTGGNANLDPAVVGGVAPTHATATGWGFNGTTQYLISGVQALDGWAVIAQFSNAANNGIVIGAEPIQPFSGLNLAPLRGSGGGVRYVYGDAGGALIRDTMPGITSGVLAIAGGACYRNGVPDGAISNTFTGASRELYLGNRNFGGVAQGAFAGNIQAIAIYDTTLTSTQVAAVSAAMAAL